MEYVYCVIVAALLVYLVFGIQVSVARVKHKIDAPATTGHPVFEKRFRIHQNTLEQLMITIPAMLLFAHYISATWAAGLGAAFVVSRIAFMVGYMGDPKGRGLGFGVGFVINAVLLLGAAWGVCKAAL